MFEKVNPSHPDKVADRIAGAMIDLAYKKSERPKIAVEVMIGHGRCFIEVETSIHFEHSEVLEIVKRISGDQKIHLNYVEVEQDMHLAHNQVGKIKCGDNGIFKGVPISAEEEKLSLFAQNLYHTWNTDGKFVATEDEIIICQSNLNEIATLRKMAKERGYEYVVINPLGNWTGGIEVDTGCTNRKLGSDMGRAVTGGGLHGKDLSKADVSLNIYAHLKAQNTGKEVNLCCAIGDEEIDGKPYEEIVEIANKYIKHMGGFEKFAECGLI